MNTEIKDTFILHFNDEEIHGGSNTTVDVATVGGFIESIQRLLISQILVMREAFPESKEAWFCGGASIGDLSDPNFLEFQFGSVDDSQWMYEDCNVYVEVPFI